MWYPNEWLLYCIHHLHKHLHVNTSLYFSVNTPWLCYSVEPCTTATLSQKYIWQERTGRGRRKDGDMRKEKRERMGKGIVEGCRAGVESVVLRSVLYCALLLGIIRSMNISLITAEKAEPSGGRVSHCSVCSHHAPPHTTLPCHTAPCLLLSTYHYLSLFPPPLL